MLIYIDNTVTYTLLVNRTIDNVLSTKLMVTFTPTDPAHLINQAYMLANLTMPADTSLYVPLDGTGGMTGTLTLSGDPTASKHAATNNYLVNEVAAALSAYTLDVAGVNAAVAASPYFMKTGDVIGFGTTVTPAGYLKSNGAVVLQASYAPLYSVIGPNFNKGFLAIGSGRPWEQQATFNTGTGPTGVWANETSSFPAGETRQAFIVKNKAYLICTTTSSTYTTTIYAATISGGVIGAWSATSIPQLPYGILNYTIVMTSSRVYLYGGADYTATLNNTFYSVIDPSTGALGSWVSVAAVSPYPGGYQSTILITKNRAYCVRGYGVVLTAPIDGSGVIGTWVAGTSIPGTATTENVPMAITKNRIYLFYSNDTPNSILSAPINTDGTIGTWVTSGTMPGRLSWTSVAVTGNSVYIFGGATGTSTINFNVYHASINVDGSLSAWDTTTVTNVPSGGAKGAVLITSSKLYLISQAWAYYGIAASVYSISCSGGLDDYTGIEATYGVDLATQFTLPDFSAIDALAPGTNSYIKL